MPKGVAGLIDFQGIIYAAIAVLAMFFVLQWMGFIGVGGGGRGGGRGGALGITDKARRSVRGGRGGAIALNTRGIQSIKTAGIGASSIGGFDY